MKHVTTYSVLGVWANAFTIETFIDTLRHAVDSRTRCIIGHHNLHSIYLHHYNVHMQAFYTVADYAFIDGMPIIWWAKLMGYPLTHHNRFTSVDWLPVLAQHCVESGWRLGYLGGKPGVAERGAEALQARFPDLQIDTRHGYFDMQSSAANAEIIDIVNRWESDILLVGMGMPRQEQWIHAHYARLNAPCILPVGAALDYWAGVIPTPSRRMSRLGFEWLARLMAEPRRLARRYLWEPWFLLPYMARDVRRRVGMAQPGGDED